MKFKPIKELLFKLPYVPFFDVFKNVIIREKRMKEWAEKRFKQLDLGQDDA